MPGLPTAVLGWPSFLFHFRLGSSYPSFFKLTYWSLSHTQSSEEPVKDSLHLVSLL